VNRARQEDKASDVNHVEYAVRTTER
jgi:hypothetical protein